MIVFKLRFVPVAGNAVATEGYCSLLATLIIGLERFTVKDLRGLEETMYTEIRLLDPDYN
jgi:hypothetical protein